MVLAWIISSGGPGLPPAKVSKVRHEFERRLGSTAANESADVRVTGISRKGRSVHYSFAFLANPCSTMHRPCICLERLFTGLSPISTFAH